MVNRGTDAEHLQGAGVFNNLQSIIARVSGCRLPKGAQGRICLIMWLHGDVLKSDKYSCKLSAKIIILFKMT